MLVESLIDHVKLLLRCLALVVLSKLQFESVNHEGAKSLQIVHHVLYYVA